MISFDVKGFDIPTIEFERMDALTPVIQAFTDNMFDTQGLGTWDSPQVKSGRFRQAMTTGRSITTPLSLHYMPSDDAAYFDELESPFEVMIDYPVFINAIVDQLEGQIVFRE